MNLFQAIEYYENGAYSEAFEIFAQLSRDKTQSEAMYYLGLIYYNGYGRVCDVEQATSWWKKAQRAGSPDAGFMLQNIAMSTICKC